MKIISVTACSVDGKIATQAKAYTYWVSRRDQQWLRYLRGCVDAVIVGGQTFRDCGYAYTPDGLAENHGFVSPHWIDDRRQNPLINAVVTRGALDALPWDGMLQDPRVDAHGFGLTAGPMVASRVTAHVQTEPWTMNDVVSKLELLGVRTLLVEGGGSLIYQFLAEDLLDEVYVTLVPCLVGGDRAPTLVDGAGFTPETLRRLTLNSCERHGDELFLHYLVQRKSD